MTATADASPAIAPSVIAGLLLAARDQLLQLGLRSEDVERIVEKTGAARSSAYEAKVKLLATIPSLVRPVGRPPAPAAPPPAQVDAVTREVLRFVMDHPGCVHGGPQRRVYADSFRRLVLDLHQKHPDLDVEELARAVEVPLDTLRDWLRAPVPPEREPADSDPTAWKTSHLHIKTVLTAWERWEGGFVPFCEYVREHLRVPYGRTAIAAILEAHGVRLRKKREGRSPDESALREAFQTFFPGAQWVGDGTPLVVHLFGEAFTFNLELNVDARTGAFTGASIRDEEDSAALLEATADGKSTTGAAPLAELVDNRPSNLTSEVREALAADGTLLIPATRARPQNKGHVEGAFGLFQQRAPPLVLDGDTEREIARELLRLVVTTWARTLNHRPRADRGGKSRVELYGIEKPTPEQIQQARAALEERLRRQEAARRTLRARQDPEVRELLAAAFAYLGFTDPGGQLLDAIARYPLVPVTNGIAIFESKRVARTLPPGADARYLLGIVRNLSQEREAELISESMLRQRLELRDALFGPLAKRQKSLLVENPEAPSLLTKLVDEAIAATRSIDRLFWLCAVGDLFAKTPEPARPELYRLAARRLNTASSMPYGERLKAVRFIADKAFPLE